MPPVVPNEFHFSVELIEFSLLANSKQVSRWCDVLVLPALTILSTMRSRGITTTGHLEDGGPVGQVSGSSPVRHVTGRDAGLPQVGANDVDRTGQDDAARL